MKTVRWEFSEENRKLHLRIPVVQADPLEITIDGGMVSYLQRTLCMLYVIQTEKREDVFFCDFRKLQVTSDRFSNNVIDFSGTALTADERFGFRRGSGPDALWLGLRGWQAERAFFGVSGNVNNAPNKSVIQVSAERKSVLRGRTVRMIGAYAAALLFASAAIVFGLAGTSPHMQEISDVRGRTVSAVEQPPVQTVGSVSETENAKTISVHNETEVHGSQDRKQDVRRSGKRSDPGPQMPAAGSRNDVRVPCTHDMAEKGVPCS